MSQFSGCVLLILRTRILLLILVCTDAKMPVPVWEF